MFNIENRRYIGSKRRLVKEIHSAIKVKEKDYKSFLDIFGGTGIVTDSLRNYFDELHINDILYSNECIYNAFLGRQNINEKKINEFIDFENNNKKYCETFFSNIYANTYFDEQTALKIGTIRSNIEKCTLNKREKDILIASLIYSADRCANTVGHYESFFKTTKNSREFTYESIKPHNVDNVRIYREDANILAKKIKTDVVYIDPPYNSRQYSRFYHVLETLVKWKEFQPMGKALKPPIENLSGYSRNEAKDLFEDLIRNIDAKLIVVSYNDTYNSSSSSSNNKIKYEQLLNILNDKGMVTVKEIDYNHFNAGKTKLSNNIEYLFTCEVYDD